MSYKLLWALAKKNDKTGPIPTGWPADYVAAFRSCRGCALLNAGECYAWTGSVQLGLASILRTAEQSPQRYTLEACLSRALRLRSVVVKAARLGPIGDPMGADRRQLWRDVETIRSRGLAILSYTHFWHWKRAEPLKAICRASCNSVEHALQAQERGWPVSVVLPWNYDRKTFWVGSTRGIVCPAQRRPGTVTCNDCRMCDVERNKRPVGFIDHSRSALAKRRKAAG